MTITGRKPLTTAGNDTIFAGMRNESGTDTVIYRATFLAYLHRSGACADALAWAEATPGTPAQLWRKCERADWLLWVARKANVERRAIARAAAACAETALVYVRPDAQLACIWAIDAARRWSRGEADEDECRAAAAAVAAVADAAYAAAAAAAAAAYAAYADADAYAAAAYAAAYAAAAYAAAYAAVADAAYAAVADAAAYAAAAAAYAAAADAADAADAARSRALAQMAPLVRREIPWGVVADAMLAAREEG